MYNNSILPEKLKQAREYRGFSQSNISEKLGFHSASYHKWEKGINNPNAKDLFKVADFLNIDINFFATKDSIPKQYDLDLIDLMPPMEKIKSRIIELEKMADRRNDEDNTIKAVKINPTLRDIIDDLRQWPDDCLSEFRAMAYAYFSMRLQKKRAG